MRLDLLAAPSALLWTEDLFNYIQEFKAGTFDSDDAYEQNGWLIVPEVKAHSAAGAFTAYFAIKAGNDASPFNIMNPLTNVAVWTVKHHEPSVNLLQANDINLPFADILNAPTALALEKLLFRGNDLVWFAPTTPDSSNDTLHGWAGDDDISMTCSGGTDHIYGDAGNDRISISDFNANTLHGVTGSFFGYGGAGFDSLYGDDIRDHLFGGDGNDMLVGNDGSDVLAGGAGADTLSGGMGGDSMVGGAGNDSFFGSLGPDTMTGGGGNDTFLFSWGGAVDHYDSGVGAAKRDVVTDFVDGEDVLRVREFTPSPVTLVGHGAFTGIDQVRWVTEGSNTTVFINGDSDLDAEMAITLVGVTHLVASDFLVV